MSTTYFHFSDNVKIITEKKRIYERLFVAHMDEPANTITELNFIWMNADEKAPI